MPIFNFRLMFSEGRSFSGHERNCAFLNTSPGKGSVDSFADISSVSGFDFPDDGRAIAKVDWDEDGDLDLWVLNRNAPQLRFLRNDHPRDNHFLAFRLQGNGTTVPRDAIGSRIALVLDSTAKPLIAALHAGEGFLAQSSKWLHLGLGDVTEVDEVVVRWSDGSRETFSGLAVDRRYRLVQGSGQAVEVPTRPSQGQTVRLAASEQLALPPAPTAKIKCLTLLSALNLLYLERPFGSRQIIDMGGGHPILINLWSSSCAPCIKELKEFAERHEELQAAGIRVVALSVDSVRGDQDEIAAAQEIVSRLKLPFTTGYADWKLIFQLQSIHNSLSPSGRLLPVPSSFLIDSQGRLSVIYKGPVGVDEVIGDLEHSTLMEVERFEHMFNFGGHAVPHDRTSEMIGDAITNTLFRFAQELESSGRTGSAIKRYLEIVERAPDHVIAYYSAGILLVRDGNLSDGKARFEKAVELDPEFGPAHYRLGVTILLQERLADGIPHLQQAIRLLPNDYDAHSTLAKVFVQLERFDEAIVQLEECLRIKPDDDRSRQMLERLRQRP